MARIARLRQLRDGADGSASDPKRIGHYKIAFRLGHGGMGVVYLGFGSDGTAVAIKVIRPELADDEAFRKRFRREVDAASKVGGSYTARVLDADTHARRPYLVTEYVDGSRLDSFVDTHGPLDEEHLRAFALALAEALSAIHLAGVIHRDLKPSNILMTSTGPRVIDFGVAQATDASSITRTGAAIGTPAWMAPEQARGTGSTPAADVFSWASLVAFAGTGLPPFGSGTPEMMLYRVVHEEPSLSRLPASIRGIVQRALHKEPSLRPTPLEIVQELVGDEQVTGKTLGQRVTEVIDRTWDIGSAETNILGTARHPRRTKLIVGAMVTLSLGIAGFFAFVGLRGGPDQTRDPGSRPPQNQTTLESTIDPPPNPREVDVASLLPSRATERLTLYGNLDGTAPDEIVSFSADDIAEAAIPQYYLRVFSWDGSAWVRIFDASTYRPLGRAPILREGDNSDGVGVEVGPVGLVDFERDAIQELAVGTQWIGASTGPFSLWVFSFDGGATQLELREKTTRGVDDITLHESKVVLATGDYAPSDPLCCPSYRSTRVIRERGGVIRVVNEQRVPVLAETPLDAASRFFTAWMNFDTEAALSVATQEAVDGIFSLLPGDVSGPGGPGTVVCNDDPARGLEPGTYACYPENSVVGSIVGPSDTGGYEVRTALAAE